MSVHLNKVVRNSKDQVYSSLENSPVKPEEIVNIHFAQKDFKGYVVLLEIEKLSNEGQRLRLLQQAVTD